ALCLASRRGPLSVMLPMVTFLSELRDARLALAAAARRTGPAAPPPRRPLAAAARRTGLAEPPPLGIMVEVPSAALLARQLAPFTDFFSIGTNDLAQYALAVDRANPAVASLYRPLHPAILRMVRSVVEAGQEFGKPVAVCGELAAEPIGIAVLVGLGIVDVSVTPVAIAGVKESLSLLDSGRVRALAEKALEAAEAADVEKLFRGRP